MRIGTEKPWHTYSFVLNNARSKTKTKRNASKIRLLEFSFIITSTTMDATCVKRVPDTRITRLNYFHSARRNIQKFISYRTARYMFKVQFKTILNTSEASSFYYITIRISVGVQDKPRTIIQYCGHEYNFQM